MQEPSLFDSFNARHLTFSQVGKGFIWNDDIQEVAKRQHSMLIGPRGSGKTTLLKMLTLPALANWNHARRREILKDMDFLAIYIPSDFSWDPEYRLPMLSSVPAQLEELLTAALFRTHTLRAIADTLYYLKSEPLPASNIFERIRSQVEKVNFDEVGERLVAAWGVRTELYGLAGLRKGLKAHLQELQRLVVIASMSGLTVPQALEKYEVLARFVFDDVVEFCDAFEEYKDFKLKWALCFDELEIAPAAIKRQIRKSIRSFDQRVLMKCSSSLFDEADPVPLLSNLDATKAREGQDFHQILLVQDNLTAIQKFGDQVFAALCRDRGVSPLNPERILGTSFFEDVEESDYSEQPERLSKASETARYAPPNGAYYRVFKKLIEKDASFLNYLHKTGVDVHEMNALPPKAKDRYVRKILGPVSVRAEFLRGDASPGQGRSRKGVPQLYSGARAMFAMCEGNPRWLIGLLGPLIDEYKSEAHNRRGPVSRASQAAVVERACTRFLALLASIRVEQTPLSPRSVIDFIDVIGDFFSDQFLASEFNPEPIGSFTVDEDASESILRLVGKAVNQGALVLVSRKRKQVESGSILSARFRMSHLLAPMFRLPLVTGRAVSLATVLNRSHRLQSALLLPFLDRDTDDH